MIEGLQLLRSNIAHYGTSSVNTIGQVQKTQEGVSNKNVFDDYLVDAMTSVNDKQLMASNISEQVITDPESVDIHDVTIAMAEANLSLTLANTVVDRLTKAWSEITTTR